MEDKFILRPFNGVFMVCFAILAVFIILSWLIFRKKSKTAKKIYVATVYFLGLVFFFVYKYWLSIDAPYSQILEDIGNGGFRWLSELPLQLCNINLILIPIAVLTEKPSFLSFAFFVAPLGAGMALAMPCAGFGEYSILLPRMLGYYGTHFLVFGGGAFILLFGFYRPSFKDIPATLLAMFEVYSIVAAIDGFLIATKLNPFANYFYAFKPDGNPILELLFDMIPYPYMYMFPVVLILIAYILLVTIPFEVSDRIKNKQKNIPAEA